MYNITIINAYAKKNIGDAAILEGCLSFLVNENRHNKVNISILCENNKSFRLTNTNDTKYSLKQMPYGYAIKSHHGKSSGFKKVFRFFYIVVGSFFYIFIDSLKIKQLPSSGPFSYIKSIKNANSIYGMGGGYLISTHPFKDYFGLTLTLIPIVISKLYKKTITFFPISFGPFASSIHKKISAITLYNTTVISRESISTSILRKVDKKNKIKILEFPDMALNVPFNYSDQKSNKFKSGFVVLTAREWLTKNKQKKFEKELSRCIDYLWESSKTKTKFIPMAFNKIEDDDNKVAKRIEHNLDHKQAMEIVNPNSPIDVKRILSKSRFAICTRMHSAILSFTTTTPFISIGYGHKAKGLTNQLGFENYYLDIDNVTFEALKKFIVALHSPTNYKNFQKKIQVKNKSLQKEFKKMSIQLTHHTNE